MRLTILTSRYPYPLDKGDKLRAYHQIKFLAQHHDIQLLCLVDTPPSETARAVMTDIGVTVHCFTMPKWRRWTSAVMAWSRGLPAQTGYFFSSAIKREIYKHIITFDPEVIYCQLIRMAAYVRQLPYPMVLDYMDCFSAGLDRQGEIQPWYKAWIYRTEANFVRRYERLVRSDFEAATIITARDRDELPLLNKAAVGVLANGIDTDFFRPKRHEDIQHDVVFVGNLGYTPNVQAVRQLRVWRDEMKLEDVRFLIAGASPSRDMLSEAETNWVVPGWMDDIRHAYRRSKIFAAPLTTGSGLQNKLLEAMACGLPCITTDLANAAVHAEPGVHLLIANDAQSFHEHLSRLMADETYRQRIGKAARTFVVNHYRWDVFNQQLQEILTDAKHRFKQLDPADRRTGK